MYNQQLFQAMESCYGKPIRFPDVISSSIIANYKACPLQAFFNGVYKARPKSVNPHLNSGKAYAVGLDTFRQSYYNSKVTFEDARQAGYLALIRSYGDHEPPAKNANKSWDRLASAYFYYLRHYHPKHDNLRPATINDKVASEFSFAIPLDDNLRNPDTGDPILYTGRFDCIMEMGSKHLLFGYDDKTTSSLGPTWSDQWGLRGQLIGYDWGARQYGLELQGTIVRGVSILKTKHEHAQAIIFFSEWLRQRWLDSTIHTVKQMIRDYESGYWDSDLSASCTTYGGCDYRMLCEVPDPESWLPVYYEHNPWNPLTGEDDIEEEDEKS